MLVVESTRWYLPDAMLRLEGRANPGDFRIVSLRGDAMVPLLRQGDRLVIDTARSPGSRWSAWCWKDSPRPA